MSESSAETRRPARRFAEEQRRALGTRIMELRRSRSWSQRELARRWAWEEPCRGLMDLKRGIYLGLDAVASHIWQSLSEHGDMTRAAEDLCRDYDVERGQAVADIESWVAELARKGLVVLR